MIFNWQDWVYNQYEAVYSVDVGHFCSQEFNLNSKFEGKKLSLKVFSTCCPPDSQKKKKKKKKKIRNKRNKRNK